VQICNRKTPPARKSKVASIGNWKSTMANSKRDRRAKQDKATVSAGKNGRTGKPATGEPVPDGTIGPSPGTNGDSIPAQYTIGQEVRCKLIGRNTGYRGVSFGTILERAGDELVVDFTNPESRKLRLHWTFLSLVPKAKYKVQKAVDDPHRLARLFLDNYTVTRNYWCRYYDNK
jgi:hypothetical protein